MKIIGGVSYPDTAQEFAEAIVSYSNAIEESIKKSSFALTVSWSNMYLNDALFSLSALNQMAQVYLRNDK